MAVRDEETGLLTGESTKRSAIFTSPTAVIFAVVLVCGAFVGGSVATGRTSFALAPLGIPDLLAVPEANNHEHMTKAEVEKAVDELTGPLEESIKLFITPFKDMPTADLLAKAVDNIKALIEADKDKYKKTLNIVVEELDFDSLNQDKFKKAVEELDAAPDPDWMAAAAARKLLGSVDGDGESLMDLAGNLASALHTDTNKIAVLFPKMGEASGKLVAAMKEKGDNLTEKEKLLEASMCLGVVSARAAPKPFGKGVKEVFEVTWSAGLEVLKHMNVDDMMTAFSM